MKPALGFIALGAAGLLIYAGWLGYSPAFIARTVLTGGTLPARRPLGGGTDTASGASSGGQAYPVVPASSGTYPLPGGTTTEGIPA